MGNLPYQLVIAGFLNHQQYISFREGMYFDLNCDERPAAWRIIPGHHGDRFHPLRIGLWDPFQMAELHGL